jgi:hypothetical protein
MEVSRVIDFPDISADAEDTILESASKRQKKSSKKDAQFRRTG